MARVDLELGSQFFPPTIGPYAAGRRIGDRVEIGSYVIPARTSSQTSGQYANAWSTSEYFESGCGAAPFHVRATATADLPVAVSSVHGAGQALWSALPARIAF